MKQRLQTVRTKKAEQADRMEQGGIAEHRKNTEPDKVLRGTPVVAAVRDSYIICVPVKTQVLMKVTVSGQDYFNHSNGIRVSGTKVQKFTIPMAALDKAREYTVTYETVGKRTDRAFEKGAPVSLRFHFRPVPRRGDINIYDISDVHGLTGKALKAGRFFGQRTDLLILNGDISSKVMNASDIMVSYDIASKLTGGEIPCIIARGNHDLRGSYAEKLEQLLPSDNGKSYYTVKLGPVWILLLDCGEDKDDSHKEYSGTACFHDFRLEESEFLKQLKKNAAQEYRSKKFRYRIILSHIPFNVNNTAECKGERPFDIEHEIYGGWCDFIRNEIRPDFMLAGHRHTYEVIPAGSSLDAKKVGCDTVIGGVPEWKGDSTGYVGAALTICEDGTIVRFTDDKQQERGFCRLAVNRQKQ